MKYPKTFEGVSVDILNRCGLIDIFISFIIRIGLNAIVLSLGFVRNIVQTVYVVGSVSFDGSSTDDTSMFRKENRYFIVL